MGVKVSMQEKKQKVRSWEAECDTEMNGKKEEQEYGSKFMTSL